MIEERFTDAERVRLLELCFKAVPHGHGDAEITGIISKLSGTDTVLLAHRAYPSATPERAERIKAIVQRRADRLGMTVEQLMIEDRAALRERIEGEDEDRLLVGFISELHLLISEMVQVSSEMLEMKSLNVERMSVLSAAIQQDIDGIEKWLKTHELP